MKKAIFLLTFLIAGSVAIMAQGGGGGMRRTVEERVKMVHEKIDSAFKPSAETLTKVDATLTTYYKGQDKLREELMSGGERPDMETMRAKMQPLTDARDKELKDALGEENFKIFKDKIEPSMRRGGGGPGGGGPGGGRRNQN